MLANQCFAYKCPETPLVVMRSPATSPASLTKSAAESPQVPRLLVLNFFRNKLHGLPGTLIIRTLAVVIRLSRLPENRKGYMLPGANNRKFIAAAAAHWLRA